MWLHNFEVLIYPLPTVVWRKQSQFIILGQVHRMPLRVAPLDMLHKSRKPFVDPPFQLCYVREEANYLRGRERHFLNGIV